MKKSRSSQAKRQVSERFRMILLFVKCCGRQPTAEELDGTDATDEYVLENTIASTEFIQNKIDGHDNNTGDTCLSGSSKARKKPPRPTRPPTHKTPVNSGTRVVYKTKDTLDGDDTHQQHRAYIIAGSGKAIDSLTPNRPLPNRRVPPKRPPPPTKAVPPRTNTPPMRPPPPPVHLVAELIKRNRKVAELGQGDDETATVGTCTEFSTFRRAIDDCPADLNPFSDTED